MPLGFPQVIGIIAGATYGGVEQLPMLVADSGDGQTGTLQVGVVGTVPISGSIVVSSITSAVTLAPLPAGSAVIGSVDIAGTLPALSAGTALIGGVELVDSAGVNKATISAGGQVAVNNAAVGIGAFTAVPGASANGTSIGNVPPAAKGVRIYVPIGGSIAYTIAAAQPAAPPPTVTFSNPAGAQFPVVIDEDLNGQNVYVTVATGTPLFRFI